MGAGYHPDGGDCYHHGAPGEFHVGQGLSQQVFDSHRNKLWAGKGGKLYNYVPKRHSDGVKRGLNFRTYTGKFKDAKGHDVFVHKNYPHQIMSASEHANYVKGLNPMNGGHNQRSQNQKGRSGKQQQQNQKLKKNKKKKDRVDSLAITLLDKIKEPVSKERKDAHEFPSIERGEGTPYALFQKEFLQFATSFKNKTGNFEGRSETQTWPKDLVETNNFVLGSGSSDEKYKHFFHIVSGMKRGIAHVTLVNSRYKAKLNEERVIISAIYKANNMEYSAGGTNLSLLIKNLMSKKPIKLHSDAQIKLLVPSILLTQSFDFKDDSIATVLEEIIREDIFDTATHEHLRKDKYKLMRSVRKMTLALSKPTTKAMRTEVSTEGLVGMSSNDRVY
jgi:predicted DNA binding CopG/RHH family protein